MTPDTPQILWSVSDVNAAVRDMLENSLMPFWLKGEVSNLVIHSSGHVYLSLKDSRTQLRAAFFGGASQFRQLNIRNGDAVEVYGRITVYEVRGEYQFSIRTVRHAGAGDLQRRFEELKKRLAAEGLFDPRRKKPIPALPRTVGVVTSPSGAAVRDFLQIISRRFPNIRIRIYPAQVQGQSAAQQLAAGVEFFNRTGCDVIVLTRGGGSMEDLWPFNEELTARAVAASRIPVISAVGHEIDFTICDFAADLRVPTPSAAAELVIGRREEIVKTIENCRRIIRQSLQYRLARAAGIIERLANSPAFRHPARLVENRFRHLDELQMRIHHSWQMQISAQKARLDALAARLDILNPRHQLRRGYAIITDPATGSPVTSAQGHPAGKKLQIHLADGSVNARTE